MSNSLTNNLCVKAVSVSVWWAHFGVGVLQSWLWKKIVMNAEATRWCCVVDWKSCANFNYFHLWHLLICWGVFLSEREREKAICYVGCCTFKASVRLHSNPPLCFIFRTLWTAESRPCWLCCSAQPQSPHPPSLRQVNKQEAVTAGLW